MAPDPTPQLAGDERKHQYVRDGGRAPDRALQGSWKAGATVLRPTYQWYIANGSDWTPIAGATGSVFIPTAAMEGKNVVVRVSAAAPIGYTAASPVASNYAQVNPANLTSASPKISGAPVIGKTLTATTGTWKAGSVTLSASHFKYQWYANGKRSLTPRSHDSSSPRPTGARPSTSRSLAQQRGTRRSHAPAPRPARSARSQGRVTQRSVPHGTDVGAA